jgi:serine/threonine protein kinase
MASKTSTSDRERTYTRDRVIIQDYGQYLDLTTRSLALPAQTGAEETKADRLQATYDLFEAVNFAKFSGELRVNNITVDFSALGGSFLAQGGFFQTRHFPGQRVAKYPLIPDDTGVLPKNTYESLLKELRILCHAPLREHDNIVKLSSIQWARIDPVAPSSIPVLLLEEAKHGSLQQYVASEKPSIETCLQLGQEVGSGLQALHASGVVHGDLKFQNVLVFDLGDGRVRAKLSDFGSSVIKDKGHQTVTLTAGTPPWTSPEHNQPVPSRLLHGTDTYSYGLLVWRLCLQGQHPFDGQDSEDIWRRKKNDLILGEATRSLEEHYQKAMLLGGQAASGTRFQLYKLFVSIPRRCLQHCLSVSIENRDLDKAVEALHYGSYGCVEKPDNAMARIAHADYLPGRFPEEPAASTKNSTGKNKRLFAKSRVSVFPQVLSIARRLTESQTLDGCESSTAL